MDTKVSNESVMERPLILLVEDDLALLDGMCDTLDMVGYKTIRATNGLEGLGVLQQVLPDLIISDIMMPEMDGYEFHRKVSSKPDTATIPFIFLTAKSDQADVRKGLREGVDAYLIKPFDLEDLLIHVQNKLDRFATIRKQALAQLEELQRQIVTMFSHELRTPLTYIQGYTDLLSDAPHMVGPDEMKVFLEGIQTGSSRLNKLVENLLGLVQLDTGVFVEEFEQFSSPELDLARLAIGAAAKYENDARRKGIVLDVDAPEALPSVRLVPGHFAYILNNLIDNAIKFSKSPGSCVKVRLYYTDDRVAVDVIDEGVGIAAKDLSHAFERFRQIDRAKYEQSGLGVGLTIARGLARIQGGDIEVVSALGEGSTFTVWLPVLA